VIERDWEVVWPTDETHRELLKRRKKIFKSQRKALRERLGVGEGVEGDTSSPELFHAALSIALLGLLENKGVVTRADLNKLELKQAAISNNILSRQEFGRAHRLALAAFISFAQNIEALRNNLTKKHNQKI
jgi:hypothetical protein